MAGFITCNTNATTWQKQFPGIRTKLCTLSFHFSIPLFREIVLAWGKYCVCFSERKLKYLNNSVALSLVIRNELRV